jgi:hypothetical protein
MKESEMGKGTHIIIADDVSNTINTHTVNDDMRYMLGKEYRMQGVVDTTHGKAGIVGGFYWHPDDLIEVVAEKKSHRFHFDIKHLERGVKNASI